LDIIHILFANAVIAIGAIVHGSVGFGLGLIAVPVLVLLNPVFVPGPFLFISVLLTLLMAFRERSEIDLKNAKKTLLGCILGTIIGGFLLSSLSYDLMGFIIGAIIILAVMLSLGGLKLLLSSFNLIISGILCGFMTTVAGLGGPPLALLYQNERGPKIRGTISFIFVVALLMSLCTLYFVGRFGIVEVRAGLALLPGILIGFAISGRTSKILDKGYTRRAILLISTINSIILIINSI